MSTRKFEDSESTSESELDTDSDSAYEERKPKVRVQIAQPRHFLYQTSTKTRSTPRKRLSPRKAKEPKLPTKASIVLLATDTPVHLGDAKERRKEFFFRSSFAFNYPSCSR